MKDSINNQELIFLRLYKDFIYQFNMLERNMVYCLSHSKRSGDYNEIVDSFMKISFDEKVKKVKKLVKRCSYHSEFLEFFELIDHCRLMRNKIVHGHWEFISFLEDPIRFDIPAPKREQGSLTIDSFRCELGILEKAAKTFSCLRSKYELADLKPNQTNSLEVP